MNKKAIPGLIQFGVSLLLFSLAVAALLTAYNRYSHLTVDEAKVVFEECNVLSNGVKLAWKCLTLT